MYATTMWGIEGRMIREWFLQTDEFLRWRDGEGESGKATLFCSGNPGVGKTFIR